MTSGRFVARNQRFLLNRKNFEEKKLPLACAMLTLCTTCSIFFSPSIRCDELFNEQQIVKILKLIDAACTVYWQQKMENKKFIDLALLCSK